MQHYYLLLNTSDGWRYIGDTAKLGLCHMWENYSALTKCVVLITV